MLGRGMAQAVKAGIAGGHPVPGRGDADLRLGEVLVRLAEGPEHRPRAGAIGT
jgi:hypothetical protein